MVRHGSPRPHDDFDGLGSRLHRGEIEVYRLSDDETSTYSRDDIEVYLARGDDADGRVPCEARAVLSVAGEGAVTADELLDLAAWLTSSRCQARRCQS